MELCAGKMQCNAESKFYDSCSNLSESLKGNASFIVGNNQDDELTHAQSMKIRCGGILGMQRVMNIEAHTIPVIPDIIAVANMLHGDIKNFPFNQIVQDIKEFSHRKKCTTKET
jgi:hypothetical protein